MPRNTSNQVQIVTNYNNLGAMITVVNQAGKEISESVAKKIAATMRGSMRGQKSGTIYHKRGMTYQASAPGEAPGVQPARWRGTFRSTTISNQSLKRLNRPGKRNEPFKPTGSLFREHPALEQYYRGSFRPTSRRFTNRETRELGRAMYSQFMSELEGFGFQRRNRRFGRNVVQGVVVPDATENLINSIEAIPIDTGATQHEWGIVMDPKGLHLEFGTDRVAPRPFIIPAVEKWRGQIVPMYALYFNAATRHLSNGRQVAHGWVLPNILTGEEERN